MIPNGEYTFKVIDTDIKVNKAEKKYIMLTLEVQDEGPYKGRRTWTPLVPWYDFNWMNNINAFFTDEEIQMYLLEERDDSWLNVVCRLIIGHTAKGRVRAQVFHGQTFASVMMHR